MAYSTAPLPRQQTPAHQVLVGLTGCLAPLGDGPDYQRGAPLGVPGDEDALLLRAEAVLGVDGAAVCVAEVHLFLEAALDGDGEAALAALLVGRVGVQDQGPVGPGEVVGVLRGLGAVGEDLHGSAALAVGVAQTVRARVPAAEDDDVLVLGADLDLGVRREPRDTPVLLGEVVHREVDAPELPSRHVQVTPLQSPDGEYCSVELALELFGRRVLADVGVRTE